MLDQLSLLDWKRQVFGLYAEVRAAPDPVEGWRRWRGVRDDLFATHPQSPLPEHARERFQGLDYFDYDPACRVIGTVSEAQPKHYEIGASGGGSFAFDRFASVRFELRGEPGELELYWLEGYGGGLFLPFADAMSGGETYGAGRYLFDTVKGADLGTEDGGLAMDFNFAYNPSCSYDPAWVCPLAPPPNRLAFAVLAGERHESD
ncbi:MAG TPA: DUF1684 domain-containing protein [Solirubrobacterales bacterium]|jgi:uncharacterized protein (DUF1684 family)